MAYLKACRSAAVSFHGSRGCSNIRQIEEIYLRRTSMPKARNQENLVSEGRLLEGRLWPVLRATAGSGDACRVRAWMARAADCGTPLGVKSVTMLIHAYAKAADVAAAQTTLHGMKRQQLHPNVQAFNGVMAACARVSDMDSTLHWLNRMQQACIAPDAVSFRALPPKLESPTPKPRNPKP
ncbi:unnamed protein product [Symbiodinium necroappetens]|uniref:Pentatricopeptide repeat-containing protein n=1 Tax=Symbiodinium necroappetens TaxID=1628268 RepID=A0A812UG92_9DINO|nr:unnamed protein product [Symbiodinium necroappetens]